jgi:glycosyltransferase involved in cell wall biosynthesis
MQVGEAWLAAMLALRLDAATADAAAAGWDGGVYRAFTDGDDALVVFDTAWDTQADADAFAQAVRDWLDAGETAGEVGRRAGGHVTFAMATDVSLLSVDLRRPVASSP